MTSYPLNATQRETITALKAQADAAQQTAHAAQTIMQTYLNAIVHAAGDTIPEASQIGWTAEALTVTPPEAPSAP